MPDGYEERLVERLKRRDEAAFNELITMYQGRIFRLVLRMLDDREEAEDLAQEVFVTVFKSIDGFRGDSKLSTWLYRVATNHCKNRLKYLQRRARGKKKEFDEIAEASALESATMDTTSHIARPDHLVEAYEKERILKTAIGELEEEHRTLIVLRDIENLTYEEIQDITGLAEGTVKSRLHRARHALREKVIRLSDGRRSSVPSPEQAPKKKKTP
ncbi:MAG: sigma-70 family RNA polymerase sigma factor [Sandaracinaceae bacterium]|nr:sigma-70 family RNA polymerase sigma factor [Sandaracinaceae bacterium]